jgi:subtilisin family serine protease
MENIKGGNYIHTFNEEEMNENKYWNDIEKAMAIGYSDVEKNLWNPVTGSTEGQDEKIFEDIYSLFKKGNYVRADSILFKELYLTRRLDDTDSEYEVAVRFLDAVISECIFKDTLKLRKERTYVKHQKQEIARLITYDPNMNDHLNNLIENYSYKENNSYLAQIKVYNDSIDCSEYPKAVYDDYALDAGSSTSFIDTLSITLLHEKPKYVEKYELKLKTKESTPQSEDWVTTEHDFGENVTLSPGKTLDILYKPKDQTFFRAVSMMCASTLFIIILLL